jgi:hypothetical protein
MQGLAKAETVHNLKLQFATPAHEPLTKFHACRNSTMRRRTCAVPQRASQCSSILRWTSTMTAGRTPWPSSSSRPRSSWVNLVSPFKGCLPVQSNAEVDMNNDGWQDTLLSQQQASISPCPPSLGCVGTICFGQSPGMIPWTAAAADLLIWSRSGPAFYFPNAPPDGAAQFEHCSAAGHPLYIARLGRTKHWLHPATYMGLAMAESAGVWPAAFACAAPWVGDSPSSDPFGVCQRETHPPPGMQ